MALRAGIACTKPLAPRGHEVGSFPRLYICPPSLHFSAYGCSRGADKKTSLHCLKNVRNRKYLLIWSWSCYKVTRHIQVNCFLVNKWIEMHSICWSHRIHTQYCIVGIGNMKCSDFLNESSQWAFHEKYTGLPIKEGQLGMVHLLTHFIHFPSIHICQYFSLFL